MLDARAKRGLFLALPEPYIKSSWKLGYNGGMVIALLFLGAIVGGLSVIFVLQNITPITVTFLSWQIEGSLAVVLLLAMMSGILVSLLVLLPSLIQDEWRYAQLKKEKKQVEDELDTTRKVINDVAGRAVVVEPAPGTMY